MVATLMVLNTLPWYGVGCGWPRRRRTWDPMSRPWWVAVAEMRGCLGAAHGGSLSLRPLPLGLSVSPPLSSSPSLGALLQEETRE